MFTGFLVIIAIMVVLVGIISLSSATAGVGLIAIGIFIAVLARINQAFKYHQVQFPPPRRLSGDEVRAAIAAREIATEQKGSVR